MDRLLHDAVGEDGGPLIHQGSEEEQRSFDSTCRRFNRFLLTQGLRAAAPGKSHAREARAVVPEAKEATVTFEVTGMSPWSSPPERGKGGGPGGGHEGGERSARAVPCQSEEEINHTALQKIAPLYGSSASEW